jgi:hypothetical protein
MKINIDEEGLELLKDNFDEQTDEIIESKTVYNPKTPAWKRRANKRINDRVKNKGKLIIPTELADHFVLGVKWFLPPLVIVTAGTELEQEGHDMAGIAWLLFVAVIVTGWWLYLKLLENPNQLWGVLWRGGLFTAGLFLGVVYGAS